MRLLEILPNGDVSLTRDLADDSIPPYAILSHRWGKDGQEVVYEDMEKGLGQGKDGYKKIKFCSHQAQSDMLRFFWVDSCCINKNDDAEVSRSIRSMFSWYRNASRCYVYLSDVSAKGTTAHGMSSTWAAAFDRSDWFKRAWTLQELLAPTSVEFFSEEGLRLGDRSSLRQRISKITNIPLSALDGATLSDFTVPERFLWAEHRQATVKEDKAYALLGIFGVSLMPIQNEGEARAFQRLQEEIDKLKQCMQVLYCTDPRKDKMRIEEDKGGLLKESYQWIMEHRDFRQWRYEQENSLLWVKNDPGTGKTMLLCGVIDEFTQPQRTTHLLSYFFCQATDSRLNNATAVLRGLLYLLIVQQPSLSSHVQHQLDDQGQKLFEGVNAWFHVSEIFTSILQDQTLPSTFLVVDALDECLVDRQRLVDLISRTSSNSRIRWLVSSRKWPSIEERLGKAQVKIRMPLESNTESISTAVSIYIRFKVDQLAHEKGLDAKMRDAIFNYLSSNANDTFLWVALVLHSIQGSKPRNLLTKLRTYPPRLDALYKRMLDQISEDEDADILKRILAVSLLVLRPVTLQEVSCLAGLPETEDTESVTELVSSCGSFLTTRNGTIYLVHQSAKDYLLNKASTSVFPDGKARAHYKLFSASLSALSTMLRRDIYNLEAPGCLIEDVKIPNPDPLSACRYSIIHWVIHLEEWNFSSCRDDDVPQLVQAIDVFMRTVFLYWLEALSLCGSVHEGITALRRLEAVIQVEAECHELSAPVADARRFSLSFREAIERAPLQVYVAALLFCPKRCLVRQRFGKEYPTWVTTTTSVGEDWSPCLVTIDAHAYVGSIAYSPDGRYIASASFDLVQLWDVETGAAARSPMEIPGHRLTSIAFSPDAKYLAASSNKSTVMLWVAAELDIPATPLLPLRGHTKPVNSVAFSPDSKYLASGSDDRTVRLWAIDPELAEGALLLFEGHTARVHSLAFSPNGQYLASGSDDGTIRLWSVQLGTSEVIRGHENSVSSVAFSPNGKYMASGSYDKTIRLWGVGRDSTEPELPPLTAHTNSVECVAFSPQGTVLASGSSDKTIMLWDAESGAAVTTPLVGHNNTVYSVAFSPDGRQLASASEDVTIRLWDVGSCAMVAAPHGDHTSAIYCATFSSDGRRIATGSRDGTIRLWNGESGAPVAAALDGGRRRIVKIIFTPDGKRMVSQSSDWRLMLWNSESCVLVATLSENRGIKNFEDIVFSPNGGHVAAQFPYTRGRLWDTESGVEVTAYKGLVCGSPGFTLPNGTMLVANWTLNRHKASNMIFRKPGKPGQLSVDDEWIMHGSQRIIWLPAEYRSSCEAVHESKLFLGHHSGAGSLFCFDFPGMPFLR